MRITFIAGILVFFVVHLGCGPTVTVAVLDGDRFCGILTPASFVAAIQRVPAEMEGARR